MRETPVYAGACEAPGAGLEPATIALTGRCSAELSYPGTGVLGRRPLIAPWYRQPRGSTLSPDSTSMWQFAHSSTHLRNLRPRCAERQASGHGPPTEHLRCGIKVMELEARDVGRRRRATHASARLGDEIWPSDDAVGASRPPRIDRRGSGGRAVTALPDGRPCVSHRSVGRAGHRPPSVGGCAQLAPVGLQTVPTEPVPQCRGASVRGLRHVPDREPGAEVHRELLSVQRAARTVDLRPYRLQPVLAEPVRHRRRVPARRGGPSPPATALRRSMPPTRCGPWGEH